RRRECWFRGADDFFVFQPAVALSFQSDEVFDRRKIPADPVHRFEIVRVRAHDPRARVLDDVREVVRRQSVIDWYDDGADLRHGVERLEHRVRVWRDVGDAIAGTDGKALQRAGPSVAPIEELLIGVAVRAVDDRFMMRIEAPGAARELERREGNFHRPEFYFARGLGETSAGTGFC